MESMPDKVQYIETETEKEKENQHEIAHFFLERDLLGHDVEGNEEKNSHSAVDIGPVIQPDMNFHIHQMARDHIKDGKVGFKCLGKCHISRRGHGQRVHFRNQHGTGQSPRQKRVKAETANRFRYSIGCKGVMII